MRRFREYGTFFDDLKRGEFMVCTDVELDPRTAAAAQQFKAINIRSFVSMPITEDGGFVALLYLNHPRVRALVAGGAGVHSGCRRTHPSCR